eukprot:CAMPEP_0113667592 /NCGR_PEP_ID=MMETSP0038_2-20120614/3524_1 /TAXON_ID=2898 /ORGANISM="Cryptomonas paramecium" /LENGTH=149 /DNA_ID=CAMNT_0000583229 /DNA_START=371 /DNA_END=817 /DNA_ORIENTATION=- /assembly_acc=CAM_ASM_000170
MSTDSTCRLCAPYEDDPKGGCGGIGPNFAEIWAVNGSLSLKEFGFAEDRLGMSSDEISLGNTLGVLGTIIIRLIIGPISDQIGVRLSCSCLLLVSSIPGFVICVVPSGQVAGFNAVRFFISWCGSSFVTTVLWASKMFSSNVVGLAGAA